MKKIRAEIFALCVCASVFAGCAAMNGDNPWAPPEKKKSFAERWDEEEKKAAEAKRAEDARREEDAAARRSRDAESGAAATSVPAAEYSVPDVSAAAVADSREIAEVVFSDSVKRMAVAYRLAGDGVPAKKGEIFAVRGKDMALRGVARLDVIDGDTLGFELLGGTAYIGDLVAAPGEKLSAEMEKAFPQVVVKKPSDAGTSPDAGTKLDAGTKPDAGTDAPDADAPEPAAR